MKPSPTSGFAPNRSLEFKNEWSWRVTTHIKLYKERPQALKGGRNLQEGERCQHWNWKKAYLNESSISGATDYEVVEDEKEVKMSMKSQ